MMRRASPSLASSLIRRSFASARPDQHNHYRLLQAALYSSAAAEPRFRPSSGSSSSFSSRSTNPVGLAGALLSAVCASAFLLDKEAQAKEPLPRDRVPKEIVLYQFEACPYCSKVRAFLDYFDIPYKTIEVNALTKKELKWSDYRMVPILMVDGERLIDSSVIIDQMCDKLVPGKFHGLKDEDTEETKWRKWVDSHLLYLMSPNIYRTYSEARETADYIISCGDLSFTEEIIVRYVGSTVMFFVSKKLKKKHNITDERAALYEAAETWVNALNGREFLGGSKPNLADLSVFGVLKALGNLQSGRDMVEHTGIGPWYSRMEKLVGESSVTVIKT